MLPIKWTSSSSPSELLVIKLDTSSCNNSKNQISCQLNFRNTHLFHHWPHRTRQKWHGAHHQHPGDRQQRLPGHRTWCHPIPSGHSTWKWYKLVTAAGGSKLTWGQITSVGLSSASGKTASGQWRSFSSELNAMSFDRHIVDLNNLVDQLNFLTSIQTITLPIKMIPKSVKRLTNYQFSSVQFRSTEWENSLDIEKQLIVKP